MTDKKSEIRNGLLDYMKRKGYIHLTDEKSEAWEIADVISEGIVRSRDDE